MHTGSTDFTQEALLVGCPLSSVSAEIAEPLLSGIGQLIREMRPSRVALYFDERHVWPKRHSPACGSEQLLERISGLVRGMEARAIFSQRPYSAAENCLGAMLHDLETQTLSKVSIGMFDDGNHPDQGTIFIPPLSKLVRRIIESGHLSLVYGGLAANDTHAERIKEAALALGVPEQKIAVVRCPGSEAERRQALSEVLGQISLRLRYS